MGWLPFKKILSPDSVPLTAKFLKQKQQNVFQMWVCISVLGCVLCVCVCYWEERRGSEDRLFRERHEHRPQNFVRIRLGRLGFEVEIQQLPHPLHGHLIVVIIQRREGVLDHIAGVRQEDKRQHPLVHALWIVDPLGEHRILDLKSYISDSVLEFLNISKSSYAPSSPGDIWQHCRSADVSSYRRVENFAFPSWAHPSPPDFWPDVRVHFSVGSAISTDSRFHLPQQ